jgi:hypothetical protein
MIKISFPTDICPDSVFSNRLCSYCERFFPVGIRKMKDHILCAIDFSESSVHSLRWASKIAICTEAHLAVLFSYRLIQTGKVADILSFKRKTEEEARQKFLALHGAISNGNDIGNDAAQSFITEIGFYSDNIENFIRKNPSTLVVLSESMANEIYEHKGQTLVSFLKQLKVPLLIVPNSPSPEPVSQLAADRHAIAGNIPI